MADFKAGPKVDDYASPTPSDTSNRLFELAAMAEGQVTVTCDVVAAYPHAEERELVYVRCPE
eukprot:9120794-Alexandrium_andersonii.AAC.1